MKRLPVFSSPVMGKAEDLRDAKVRRVINFVLGPEGTNMQQACQAWITENGIDDKSEIVLCSTPEDSLVQARLVTEEGVVPTFWTCAVFYALNQLFFGNPDVFPFAFIFTYPLDNMQLCRRADVAAKPDWKIASHPSPAPLVAGLGMEVVPTTSNAQAAKLCAGGEVEACITTAQAAKIRELTMVHEFGSPDMVFFAGTTQHGLNVLLGK